MAAVVVVLRSPDDGGGAADRDGEAELIKRRAVIWQELGNLIAEVGVGHCGNGPANEAETNRSNRRDCEA